MSKYSNLIQKEVLNNIKNGSNIVSFHLVRALYDDEMVLRFKRHISSPESFKILLFGKEENTRGHGTIPFDLIEFDDIEYRTKVLNAANNEEWDKVINLILYSGKVAIEKIESIVRF